jgi:para-nitrobenzyl esterase
VDSLGREAHDPSATGAVTGALPATATVTATATVAGGELRGRRLDGPDVDVFLGIPYAAPPRGAGRWAPPDPAPPWSGVRDACAPGPVCPQPDRPFSEWAHGPLPATDEDSLTVNVWRPSERFASGRPVVVFIHGGGWAIGWGSSALLDGRHLARALDAVVVTFNYRLGSLGWVAHPALAPDPGAPSANWGLADQLAALRWVAENVAAFGGDPTRVTLAGESAGAGSALHLLVDPRAVGLVSRVAALSPPLHELVVPPELAERWTVALVDALGLGDDVAAALPALRDVPVAAIVDAQEELLAGPFHGTRGGALPVLDPATLPNDPARSPQLNPELPLLIGSNADEGRFFFRAGGRRVDPGPDRLAEMVGRIAHSEQPDALIAAAHDRLAARGGPDPSANDILCAVVTEAWFAGPTRQFAAARARVGASVHRYRIEHPSAEADLGALHSLSVPLLFASWREGGVARRLAGDGEVTGAVSAAIQDDWRRFVHGEALGWPAVPGDDAGVQEVVYGGAEEPRTVRAAADPPLASRAG